MTDFNLSLLFENEPYTEIEIQEFQAKAVHKNFLYFTVDSTENVHRCIISTENIMKLLCKGWPTKCKHFVNNKQYGVCSNILVQDNSIILIYNQLYLVFDLLLNDVCFTLCAQDTYCCHVFNRDTNEYAKYERIPESILDKVRHKKDVRIEDTEYIEDKKFELLVRGNTHFG